MTKKRGGRRLGSGRKRGSFKKNHTFYLSTTLTNKVRRRADIEGVGQSVMISELIERGFTR